MLRKKSLYPITLKLLKDRRSLVYEVFRKVEPHKEAFIGVCELEGCFLVDEPEALYSSLAFGERLAVVTDETNNLSVRRANGTEIGILPYADAVLPKMLISRGISPFCYVEAKELNNGTLAVAVSIYCDKY